MTGMKTIQLNRAADATTQVKDDLLKNNLDKLVIDFDIDAGDTQRIRQNVFDPQQKEIKFDIEILSKSARMLFSELKNLQTITGKIEAPKLKKAEYMFEECENLTTLPKLCFPKLEDAYSMFIGCSKLVSVDLDFPNLKNASCMFGGCESLTTIKLQYNKNMLKDSSFMFSYCTSLTSIPALNFSSVSNAGSMFANCTGFTSVPNLSYPYLENASGMFKNCSGLTSVGDLNFPKLKDASGMFEGCGKIASTGKLDFGSNAEIYHCFLDDFSIFETGIPYFKDNYLKGTSVYPDWYFRSSISNTIFNFDTFFDEMFKFISSYRGLGEHGFGIKNLQNAMLNKQLHIDVIEIYSRIMRNYLNSSVAGPHTVDLSSPPPLINVLNNDRDSDCIGSILDMLFEERKNRKHGHSDYSAFELRHLMHESCFNKATPLNNFEIEFSNKKEYIVIEKYKVSVIIVNF
jgi:hypothetical protein